MIKVDHIGIVVEDADVSLDFYTQGLDFSVIHDFSNENMRLVFLKLDEVVIELIQYFKPREEERNLGRVDHLAFQVDNLDIAIKRVQGIGAELLMDEPRIVGEKRIIFFTGPDGERLEFCELIK